NNCFCVDRRGGSIIAGCILVGMRSRFLSVVVIVGASIVQSHRKSTFGQHSTGPTNSDLSFNCKCCTSLGILRSTCGACSSRVRWSALHATLAYEGFRGLPRQTASVGCL